MKDMKKIYFIEGTPGVGKTTYINRLLSQNNGQFRKVYSADVVPENMVRKAIKDGQSLSVDEARCIYHKRSYADYRCEHMHIWNDFCVQNQDNQTTLVVDAGLMQAPLYELMGLYLLSPEQICSHTQEIVDIVKQYFIPELVYIKTPHPGRCIRKAIENQQQQRTQWVKGFCTWLEVAPYPLQKGYSDLSGIEQFVADRALVDAYLIDNLMIEKGIRNRDFV